MNISSGVPESASPPRRKYLRFAVLAVAFALMTFGLVALLVNIFEHKQEAKNPFFRVVELTDTTEDPSIWGKNFPLQYDGYLKTVDMVRTRFGGSEAWPRTPSPADPRTHVSQSKIEEDERLKIIWDGYAFAVDFREERGHAYMLEDQTFTDRQKATAQPGTCVHCHASVYVPYRTLGQGDPFKGFEAMNKMPYGEARKHVSHPVSCIDCHDSQTMQLRVTRPAFLEGIAAAKRTAGIEGYDPNQHATRQEMRTFVCAQCHVEYYFQGPDKRLTYPWLQGTRADDILSYYDKVGHKDWTHARTGANVLKAQHPEFEMWSQGIHARSGVACADCHMPYQRVGALKISDHHVRSPLLNINNACQTCHNFPEAELLARAESIQKRTAFMRDLALNAVVELIGDIEKAIQAGANVDQLEAARGFQRKAQFLVDFVESENSMGFHADQEAARLLTLSIDYSRRGQISVRDVQHDRGDLETH